MQTCYLLYNDNMKYSNKQIFLFIKKINILFLKSNIFEYFFSIKKD